MTTILDDVIGVWTVVTEVRCRFLGVFIGRVVEDILSGHLRSCLRVTGWGAHLGVTIPQIIKI
jgi:hypothetical protein